jgi:hypothetical protein
MRATRVFATGALLLLLAGTATALAQEEEEPEESVSLTQSNEQVMLPAQGGQDPGGNSSAHIPDELFHAHFGPDHRFHIGQPVVVAGNPRFQYSGYWFVILDPWPVEWRYTDDYYIDYLGGLYYLCNPMYPGVLVFVNIVGRSV